MPGFTPIQAHEAERPLIFHATFNPTPYGPKAIETPAPAPLEAKPKVQRKTVPKVQEVLVRNVGRNNNFAKGQCTDYVARKVPVTWRGNANRWIANAKAQGYKVDKIPSPGNILVSSESWYGHVMYIESVNGSKVTISEWNYAGLYKTTIRTLDISDPKVKGVIHIN